MPTLPVFNTNKEEVTQIDLSDAVLARSTRMVVLRRRTLSACQTTIWKSCCRVVLKYLVVVSHSAKGTERARAGTTRAVHWRGGGVVHGPQVRSRTQNEQKA